MLKGLWVPKQSVNKEKTYYEQSEEQPNTRCERIFGQDRSIFHQVQKQVITAVVVVLVIAGGIPAYIFGYSKPREEKHRSALVS